MTALPDLELRPYQPSDLPEILELQHRYAPPDQHWSEERGHSEMTDAARGHGANTRVIRSPYGLLGAAGWVDMAADDGEFYGAPFLVADESAASRLLEHLVARGNERQASWLRIGSWPTETIKLRLLERAGCTHVMDFIYFQRLLDQPPLEKPPAAWPFPDLHPVEASAIDPQKFVDLYNACFADAPNAPTTTVEVARETWQTLWPEASQVLADNQNRYQAFILTLPTGYIDAVGIMQPHRRRGLARALIHRALHTAKTAGLAKATSLCASPNRPSLAMHESLGFTETIRRTIWQLDL